jgi:hypothetical protein
MAKKNNKRVKRKQEKTTIQPHPQEAKFVKIREYFQIVNSTISEIIYNILLEIPRDRLLTNVDIINIIKKIKDNPKLKNVNIVLLLKYFQSFGYDFFDDIFNKFYSHICSGGLDIKKETSTVNDVLKYLMCLKPGDKTFNQSTENMADKLYYLIIHNIHIYNDPVFIQTFNTVYDKILKEQKVPNNIVISLGDSLSKIVDGINFSNYKKSSEMNNKLIDTLLISGNITEYYTGEDGVEYLKLSSTKVADLKSKDAFMRNYLFKNIIDLIRDGKTITFIDYGFSGRALITLDYIFTKILFPSNLRIIEKIKIVNFTNKEDNIRNLLDRLSKDPKIQPIFRYKMSIIPELINTPIPVQIIESEDYEARCVPQFPVDKWSIKNYKENMENPIYTNYFDDKQDFILNVAKDLKDHRLVNIDVKGEQIQRLEYKSYFGCNLNRLFCNIMVLFHMSDTDKLQNTELLQDMGIELDIVETKKYPDILAIFDILWDIFEESNYSNLKEKLDKGIVPDEMLHKIMSFLKLNPAEIAISEIALSEISYKEKYLKYKLKYLKLKKNE